MKRKEMKEMEEGKLNEKEIKQGNEGRKNEMKRN